MRFQRARSPEPTGIAFVLAARAPYFHNGIAAPLEDVVHHLGFIYRRRTS